MKKLTTLAKKKLVITALEDIKAHDIVAIDVRKLTSIFDWIVVASADSARQTKALSRHVRDTLKENGAAIVGTEGEESGYWNPSPWVLTRLHTRYSPVSLTEDLIFHEAQPVTGGRAYFPKSLDEVEAICRQIARELRDQYTIGYYPGNKKLDGTRRVVTVNVLNPPRNAGKLSVHAPTEYVAPIGASQ